MKKLDTIGTICPVCGYDLELKAWDQGMPRDDEICPSCGTQFGYHDSTWDKNPLIHYELRQKWISKGMRWSSLHNPLRPQPDDWNPQEQLKNIPIEFLGPDEHY